MANSSSLPLLSLPDEQSSQIKHEETSKLTFDKIIEHSLSGFGLSQLLQTILVGFAMFFDSQLIFINLYTDAYPKWHCIDHSICDPMASDVCELPRSAWDWDDAVWKSKSVISDFGLECSSSLLRNLPTTAFFVGWVVGGFLLVMIPDNFLGRKKLVFFSTLAMTLTGITTSFSPNLWIYTSLKFLIGSVRSLLGAYVFVLISERVATRWRPRAGMIPLIFYVLGFMSPSCLSYVTRNASWRILYLTTSIPTAFYSVCLYLFALESPRWLNMVGRKEDAMNVLKKIATVNKSTLESLFSQLINKDSRQRPHIYSVKDLFIRRWAFKRILVVMIIGFGIGMSYHGVPFVVGDNYIDETLNGLVELPSFILTPLLLEKFNRRSSLFANNLIGIILGVLCFVLKTLGSGKAAFGFQLASSFCSRMGFNLIMVYVVEMFPTCVRNSATTMVTQTIVIGGICAPMISPLGINGVFVPIVMFGSSLFFFCLLVLALPETKDSSLCDTMEEQVQRYQTSYPSHG